MTMASLKRRLDRLETSRGSKIRPAMIAGAAALFDRRMAVLIARTASDDDAVNVIHQPPSDHSGNMTREGI